MEGEDKAGYLGLCWKWKVLPRLCKKSAAEGENLQTELDTAYTWFFERLSLEYLDKVRIVLAEGIQGDEPEYHEIEGVTIGPAYPVRVTSESRRAELEFEGTMAHQAINESYGTGQLGAEGEGRFLASFRPMEYLDYLQEDSLVGGFMEEEHRVFHLWTEDQIFYVVAGQPPAITLVDQGADTEIERYGSFVR